MTKGFINKIFPFSSVDGPGNRAAIFLQGCNFDCLYCHNPETINYENILKYTNGSNPTYMSVEEVLEKIQKTRAFISGITVSGGECTLQAKFLVELFTEAHKLGLSCFIDTNGSIPLCKNEELVSLIDMAMIDLKAFDSSEHKMLTGVDNFVVIENINYMAKLNKLYEIRTVIVPDILSNEYNVHMTSSLIASLNPDIKYKLIKYRPMGVRLDKIKATIPNDKYMENLKCIANENGCRNVIIV